MRLFRSRKYAHGSRWALWRWTDVPSRFIVRLHLVMTPWFSLVLHWIKGPDPEPHLHDHPVSFVSLILWGAYTELRYQGPGRANRMVTHNWFNRIQAGTWDRHRIVSVRPHTTTLCLMGPKRREWGYHLRSGRWMHYRDYQRSDASLL